MSGEIEVDETKLYKQKVSHALARPYSYGDIWVLGFKERNSGKILIYPTNSRKEEVFYPLLLKHATLRNQLSTQMHFLYMLIVKPNQQHLK